MKILNNQINKLANKQFANLLYNKHLPPHRIDNQVVMQFAFGKTFFIRMLLACCFINSWISIFSRKLNQNKDKVIIFRTPATITAIFIR